MELVERAHPLGVTLGEVVVDRHHVNTVSCEGVEEHGQRGDEGLTFTCGHLGNLALVQGNATEYLYIVVDHVPFDLVAASCPLVMVDGLVAIDGDKVVGWVGGQLAVEVGGGNDGVGVLLETASRVLHDAVCHRHYFVKSLLESVKHLLVLFVDLVEDGLALIDGSVFDLCLQFRDLFAVGLSCALYVGLDLFRLGTQFVVAQLLDVGIDRLHLFHQGLDELHVSC